MAVRQQNCGACAARVSNSNVERSESHALPRQRNTMTTRITIAEQQRPFIPDEWWVLNEKPSPEDADGASHRESRCS